MQRHSVGLILDVLRGIAFWGKSMFRLSIVSLACLGLVFLHANINQSTVKADLTINLNAGAGMTQQSQDAFRVAADFWESRLDDNITVTLDIDFRTLDNGVLGSAQSSTQIVSISDYLGALALDASSAEDAIAVANLPTLNGSNAITIQGHDTGQGTKNGRLQTITDNDNSGNNRFLALNTANAKAVGIASSASSDASIAFSDAFSWDFDPSDGIGAGLRDFVGVAIHEIGHALGFRSGVDSYDFQIETGQFDLDGFAVYTGWDMFRYSAPGVHDLTVGTASYFSIDGGTTNLGLYSTGVNNGDGRQASHWKDNLGLGIMDPTALPPGNVNVVSNLDLLAFDIMGWDLSLAVVPEPGTFWMFGSALFLLAPRSRRKSDAV